MKCHKKKLEKLFEIPPAFFRAKNSTKVWRFTAIGSYVSKTALEALAYLTQCGLIKR